MSGRRPGPELPPRLGRATGGADAVLRDGRVFCGTGPGGPRFADALAIRDGRVLRAGTWDAVSAEIAAGTEVIDLDGRTVIPGLIDSHMHLVRAGMTWTEEVFWYEVDRLEDALRRLDDRAARTPPGRWLRVVGGWHPGQFEEGRGPTSPELSRRYPDHPVYVQLLYEEAVLNAAGMAACGIVPGAPDPERGAFDRDRGTGAPTGTVRGVGAFAHCLSHMPDPAFDDQVEGTRQAMAALNAFGVTGVIDAGGLGMRPESYEPLFELWRRSGLTIRTRLYVCPTTRGSERTDLTGWLRHTRPDFGDAWLRHVGLGEIAHFGCHDLEGLTAFRIAEGVLEELEAVLRDAAERRWPVHMHSVLDATTDAILGVWERISADHPIDRLRWSLAHVEPVSDANLDRIAALGVGIAVQDRMVYRATDSARAWGDAPVRRGPPLRSIVDRGIPLGAGTDSTRVTSPNPWVSLWWLTTGRTFDDGPERDPEQRLDRLEALAAYTSGSAWFSAEEHERGRLEPGMAADLAVLTDDYFDVADDAIRSLGSVLTLVDGRPVHARGPFEGLH